MNFSDKVRDEEFMNLPEVEDDIEEEEEESFLSKIGNIDFSFLPKELSLSREEDMKMRKDKIDRNIELFVYVDAKLKDLGFEDKEERYRIIEHLF